MTVSQTNSACCEAGYGRPPRHTQFKTGQSGDPGGRPRGRTARRVEEPALHKACRTVAVKEEDGRTPPLSVVHAILRSEMQMAGSVGARCAILTVIQDVERAADVEARLAALREPVSDDDDADPDDGDDEAADPDGDDDDDDDFDDDDDDEDDDLDDDDEDDDAEPEEIDTDVEREQEDGE